MRIPTITLAFLLAASPASAQDTCEVQSRLKALGYFEHEVTCSFGPITDQALREFQRDRGLVADGVVGEDTAKALFADNERKAPPVVERRRRRMTDQEEFARCGEEISATVQRGWEGRGIKGSIKAWEAEARKQVGLEYGQWSNAIDKTAKCIPTGVLSVVNCTATGRPCKPE